MNESTRLKKPPDRSESAQLLSALSTVFAFTEVRNDSFDRPVKGTSKSESSEVGGARNLQKKIQIYESLELRA
jgi:hypothetical protein